MVKISLTRTGKRNQPHYRVVIRPARSKRDGKALEYIGYYNPRTSPTTVKLELDRVKYWLSVGAQPTDTVRDMLIKEKLLPEYKQPGEKSQKALKREKKDESADQTVPPTPAQSDKKEDVKAEEKSANAKPETTESKGKQSEKKPPPKVDKSSKTKDTTKNEDDKVKNDKKSS